MTRFTVTIHNEVLSPGRKRGDDIHSPGELQCPPSSISHLPRSINKACFVRSMNENSFLLCILLKLESYGLLPLMTFTGFRQPHVQIWLTSHPPNSPSVMLTSRIFSQSEVFYHEGPSTVMEQIKALCNNSWKHNIRPFFTWQELINSSRSEPKTLFLKSREQSTMKYIYSHCKNNDWKFQNIKWISWINGLWL